MREAPTALPSRWGTAAVAYPGDDHVSETVRLPRALAQPTGSPPTGSPPAGPQADGGRRSMLARGLSILDCFRPGESTVSLSELARRTCLPKPTTHRLVNEMVDWGVLERCADGIRLGHRLFALGSRVPAQRLLRQTALPHLEKLHQLTREVVTLSVLDGASVVQLASVRRCESGVVTSWDPPGAALPAMVAGAALLAYQEAGSDERPIGGLWVPAPDGRMTRLRRTAEELSHVVEHGYAVVALGRQLGLAAPVLAPSGAARAAVSVTGPAERLRDAGTGRQLVASATAVARALVAAEELGGVLGGVFGGTRTASA
jgi:IclR family acetate operon transcriptional repressor